MPLVKRTPLVNRRIWQAIRDLERRQMGTQAEVDALTAAVQQIAADLTSAHEALQKEINELAAGHPAVNLAALQAAVAPVDAAAKALSALKPE